MTIITRNIDAAKINESIEMLNKYVNDESIKPVIAVLETLRQDTTNEDVLRLLIDTFNNLGIIQGAVLTYAPYVGLLVCDDPFAGI